MSATEVRTEVSLSADLSGLLGYTPDDYHGHQGMIQKAFAGKTSNPLFRIPAADTGVELFFNNRELFCRFAAMPLPSQKEFVIAVRAAAQKENVTIVYLDVQWSEKKTRRIKITLSGLDPRAHMDIDL